LRARCFQRLSRMGVELPGTYFKVIGKHLKLTEALELLPEKVGSGLWSFSFVRNTWDWLVSIYHYILKDVHHPDHGFVVSLGSFERFLEWYLAQDSLVLQSDFVCLEGGEIGVDFIGRFERLQEDYEIVAAKVGLPMQSLAHSNPSSRSRDYRIYYNDQQAEQVASLFREDIERFNFRFDPET